MSYVDVLIPTFNRAAALAVTLTSLAAQTTRDFRVVVSDQTESTGGADAPEVRAAARVLRSRGHAVEITRGRRRRGMAEQRQFLLDQATAPFVLFLDDDLILEPDVVERMARTLASARCGFVGMAVHGLSFAGTIRPDQEAIAFWDGPIEPETVTPRSPAWERYKLHNAANLWHVQRRLGLTPATQRLYRVAWVGGCAMYDAEALRSVGGFRFWEEIPPDHAGEDVLAQLRVMARFGGCGIIPSGVYHMELPTTVPDRRINAPEVLPVSPDALTTADSPKSTERRVPSTSKGTDYER